MASLQYQNGGSNPKPDTTSVFMRFMDITNTITHLALGGVTCSILPFGLFFGSRALSQHTVLCVIGYVVLMSQSILVMSQNNGWSRSYNDQERRVVHLVMQIVGSILAIAGCGIGIYHTNYHFASAHGCLGIIAMVLTIISLVGGAIHFYANCAPRFTRISHCILGLMTITWAFLALIFGVNDVYRLVFSNGSTNFLISITVIGLVGTLLPGSLKCLME